MAELLIDGKNTMTVGTMDEFESHRGRTLKGVLDPTGGTEAALTAERDKLEVAAMRTAIHGTAKGRIAAVEHAVNIFNDDFAWM